MITLDNINNIKGDYGTKLSRLLNRNIKNSFIVWSFTNKYSWDNTTIQLVVIFPFNDKQNHHTIDIMCTQYDISNDILYLGTTHNNKSQQLFVSSLIEILKPIASHFMGELINEYTLSEMKYKIDNELNNHLRG